MARILEGKNRASADEAASFVDKFEELEAEVASERGKFMAACKAIRERQKELLEDAKSQGVKKSVVKAIAKARELEARARDMLADIDDDEDRTYAVDIRKALGDDFSTLPLGAAAVEAGKGNGLKQASMNADLKTPDPVAAAAEKAWKDAEPKKGKAAKH